MIARALTAPEVAGIEAPGTHAVGGVVGLCLQVTATGARSWLLRIKVGERRREFGLGAYPTVPLPDAHDQARALRNTIGGGIPVPPKYQSKDFLKTDFWRLRGGLDVPKERWVSYPGCERGADGSLPITWAGWNHLQQATALAGYYVEMKDTEGWDPARLQPLLAGLLEMVPWLEQWHNELDPIFGERMGTYYRGFVAEEARTLGFTHDDLRAWKPAGVATKRGRKKAAG